MRTHPHINVSVVIPMYNAERYIEETIQSVLSQTYEDLEVLIVNDGSTDDSLSVCRRFDDPRIRILCQENRGLAGARNTGIRHAQGKFIALLDADDLWLPTKLEEQVAHLENNPGVGVSFCLFSIIDDHGEAMGRSPTSRAYDVSTAHLLMSNPLGNGSTIVVRREVFEAIAIEAERDGQPATFYFDERFRAAQGVEDLDCWLRISALTDWRIACCPKVLVRYRFSANSMSNDARQMVASWDLAVDHAEAYAAEVVRPLRRPAKARLLQYLAGRAVRARNPDALPLMVESLRLNPSLPRVMSRRTGMTLCAALALWALPRPVYERLERAALKRYYAAGEQEQAAA